MANSEGNGEKSGKGRKKQNVRFENALDTDAIESFQDSIEKIDKRRKSLNPSEKDELTALAKKRGRYVYNIKRHETRMANRMAGPKDDIDIEDLL